MNQEAGFTIIELIVVIVIIGILTTISFITPAKMIAASRDTERADDTASIARQLELDYTQAAVGTPSYPSNKTLTDDAVSGKGTLASLKSESYTAPGDTSSSITTTNDPSLITQTDSNKPALNEYLYQPITSDNKICKTAAQICVKFRLYYVTETNGQLLTLRSVHQQ